MSKTKVPPRLFIIFAKEAHEAVIFRRGPAAWCHVIRWDTKADKFYPGAWIRGRIYPERCDLSPDGELLLYFIHQGRKLRTDYTDSWNAISRSPWLAALGLWPQGTTYGGGGRFSDNRSAVLRFYPVEPHPDHPGTGLNISFLAADTSFYRKMDLVPLHESTKELEGVEWTGRDQSGRLIYTNDGKIMCVKDKKDKTKETICLADLNGLIPNPQPAPDSATTPLVSKRSNRRTKREYRREKRKLNKSPPK
ncbi:MAG: hypothetical protein ACAH83_06885 [Alphaproteobacteria bacterium]